MTTITPDLQTEEGKKLLSYQPGEEVMITFRVASATDTTLNGEVTACEPAGEEEQGEGEGGEEGMGGGKPMMEHRGVPRPVMIAIGTPALRK